MARKIFFSFHFKRDSWRAGQVRNSNLLLDDDQYGYIDSADWEKIEKQGDPAIEKWIGEQLKNTSVTVVLIGAETSTRPWVKHEIKESINRGNAFVGVWIHNVKDSDKQPDAKGANPLEQAKAEDGTLLSSIYKTYDWVLDNGRDNLGKWVEEAYQIRENSKAKEKRESGGPEKTAAASPTIIKNPPGQWSN